MNANLLTAADAISEWSPDLIGHEPCTGEYREDEWDDLLRVHRDAVMSRRLVVLVRSEAGRYSLWAFANDFFSELSDIEKAAKLRDLAKRRLTGRDLALVSHIADGQHVDRHGEWRSSRDLRDFQALLCRPELQPFLNPKPQH